LFRLDIVKIDLKSESAPVQNQAALESDRNDLRQVSTEFIPFSRAAAG